MSNAKGWHFPTFHLGSPDGALAGKLGGARIRELYGRERISQLFHFELLVVSPEPLTPDELLDAPVTIFADRELEAGTAPVVEREIGGIVSSVRDRMVELGWAHEYVLEIVPPLFKTTLTTTTDVYQELSVPEIVEKILTEQYEWKAGQDFQLRLDKGAYPKRDFVVQYEETHFAFIARLCEHVGIFFCFEWHDGHGIVVFGDQNAHFEKAAPEKAIFMPRGEQTHVFELEAAVRQAPATYRVRDYDFRLPQVELAADSAFNKGLGGVMNEFGGPIASPDEAKRLAQIRAELATAEYLVFEGRGEYTGFRAGATFSLDNHPAPIVSDGPLLLTEVTHHVVQASHGQALGGEVAYKNTFRAIPAKTPFRPPRLTKKPLVSGLVTAFVESPQKDGEKYGAIDKEGNYRLNFHHDSRLNLKAKERPPAKASLPVRMAQPSAGGDRKLHFPLKHGTEVVVSCINGDPDRPVIVGAVPDLGEHSGKGWRGSPVRDDNKEKLILKTNLNELSIDDTEGKPRWRTQVNNGAHVHLLGEPEQEKGVKTQIPEKGHGIASEDNLTATVNKSLTFESSDMTALAQVYTLLTHTKNLDFTGEDPGWADWKHFEQALAKVVEWKRMLDELTVATKKKQAGKAAARSQAAKNDTKQAQKDAIAGINSERKSEGQAPLAAADGEEGATLAAAERDNDRARAGTQSSADAACAEEAQKEKELAALERAERENAQRKQEATRARDKAERDVASAGQRKRDAKAQSAAPRATPAERSAAQADYAAADENERRAQAELAAAQAELAREARPTRDEVAQKKNEVESARAKCREARQSHAREERKKEHIESAKRAEQKQAKAEAAERRVTDFWKAIDAKVEAGKATEVTELDKPKPPAELEKKDLWSKIAKELSDSAHEAHLKETKAGLEDAAGSLEASTEREAAKAGEFKEPYSIRVSKDSTGLVALSNLFLFGDAFATLYSHRNTQIVSGELAHVKAEKGIELATDDWIKITSTKVIDLQCDKDVKIVADSDENKAMPGGHTMLLHSNKGIHLESATATIEAKAQKSIEMTASMTGIKLTADLANIEMTASVGQVKGTATAGFMWSTPAMVTASAGGAQTYSAGGAITMSAGGAYTALAGAAATVTAGAALTLGAGAAATLAAAGVVTIAGSGLMLL